MVCVATPVMTMRRPRAMPPIERRPDQVAMAVPVESLMLITMVGRSLAGRLCMRTTCPEMVTVARAWASAMGVIPGILVSATGCFLRPNIVAT